MIIRKMTASFGRLENESLTLREGLNIVYAPNEWGKSTWCAFVRCMLFGVDSAQREKAGVKPDKLRYAPWSGAPMAGVMDIQWHGENIQLRRDTRLPTAPMREFSAVYSATGDRCTQLNGTDAGETLLGIHEEVFRRTAFISQGGLSVSNAAELEKKIAAIVTAGEADASYTEAAEQLRTWQRRRQWRGKGRLPEVEAELQQICQRLAEMETLHRQISQLQDQTEELRQKQLELQQRQRSEQFNRREEALIRLEKAQTRQEKLEDTARQRRQEAVERLNKLKSGVFAGENPEVIYNRLEAELRDAKSQGKKKPGMWLIPALLLPGLATLAAGYLRYSWLMPIAVLCLVLGLVVGVFVGIRRRGHNKALMALYERFAVSSEEQLWERYDSYAAAWEMAQASVRLAKQVQQEADTARQEQKTLRSQVVAQLGEEGNSADTLRQLNATLQQLHEERTVLRTRLETLGDPLVLATRQRQLTEEKERLNQELSALEVAIEELTQANDSIRAEFSPQLTRRAAYWMSRLTNGRYSELTLNRELDAMLRRAEDIIPHDSSFLSQGTRDQLYLAIRLALCELVLPAEDPCPIVLDDALVAFDDERLGYAMDTLTELAKTRQIILFTCQHREEEYMKKQNRGG